MLCPPFVAVVPRLFALLVCQQLCISYADPGSFFQPLYSPRVSSAAFLSGVSPNRKPSPYHAICALGT